MHEQDALPADRRRWMRPNAHLWLRPDAQRFMRPDAGRWMRPSPRARSASKVDAGALRTHASVSDLARPALTGRHDADAAAALSIKSTLAALRFELALVRFALSRRPPLAKYDPDQPRVPAGNPDGGQWTSGGGGTSEIGEFSSGRRSRGHHYVTREIFDQKPLPPATRKVFEEATTGRTRDPRNNKYDGPHRQYNRAIMEHFDRFVERRNIDVSRMTPDQARAFLQEVLESRDPRIRDYNMRLLMREIMRRVRPRGDQ